MVVEVESGQWQMGFSGEDAPREVLDVGADVATGTKK
jgi:hypothetical protein